MKKIMFSDAFSLTEAVLSGRKTQTRRIIKRNQLFKRDPDGMWTDDEKKAWEKSGISESDFQSEEDMRNAFEWLKAHAPYKVGEVVAVAQAYKDFGAYCLDSRAMTDKRFVKAEYMPHQIRITNVRVEKLQDISDDDCLAEGVEKVSECENLYRINIFHKSGRVAHIHGSSPRAVYAALIDRISGKDTFQSNPWVFVYDFELVK